MDEKIILPNRPREKNDVFWFDETASVHLLLKEDPHADAIQIVMGHAANYMRLCYKILNIRYMSQGIAGVDIVNNSLRHYILRSYELYK